MTKPIEDVTGKDLEHCLLDNKRVWSVVLPSGAQAQLRIQALTLYSMCGGRTIRLRAINPESLLPDTYSSIKFVDTIFRSLLLGIVHMDVICEVSEAEEDVAALCALVERWLDYTKEQVVSSQQRADVTWSRCDVTVPATAGTKTQPLYVVHYIDYHRNSLFQGPPFRGCYLCGTEIPRSDRPDSKCPACSSYLGSCGGYHDNTPCSLERKTYTSRYIIPERYLAPLDCGCYDGRVLYCFHAPSSQRLVSRDLSPDEEDAGKLALAYLCRSLVQHTSQVNRHFAVISSCMNAAASRGSYRTDLVIASLWANRGSLSKYGLRTCWAPSMAVNPREHYHAIDSVIVMVDDWKKVAAHSRKQGVNV